MACICMWPASQSITSEESKYFNHHKFYYNKITIICCFNILSMYEHYVQVMSINYTLIKLTAIPHSISFQLPLYDYFYQFLLNFEFHCQLKHLLLLCTSIFVLTSVFDIDFLWKASHFNLQRVLCCAWQFSNLLWVNQALV